MKRQPDGRFRGNREAIRLSDRIAISRWLEREVIRLKRMGVASFETIADLLSRAGRGEHVPGVNLPESITFPSNYRVSRMGCCKAYRRRMEREPNLEAAEHRRLDTERCEEMFLALQSAVRQGDPRSIEVATKILSHKAEINGLKALPRIETGATQVNVLVEQQREGQAFFDPNRLTVEELREYRRLEAKARGIETTVQIEVAKTHALIETSNIDTETQASAANTKEATDNA